MNAMELLTGPFGQALGWAILHLLWQATLVAAILAATLALLRTASANSRYLASSAALALVFAMFIVTAVRAYDPAARPISSATETDAKDTTVVPLTKVPILIAATAAATWRDRALEAVAAARQMLPSVVALWFAGVVVLSSRLLVSWLRIRLLLHGTVEASAAIQRAAGRLADALGVRQTVRLLESASVQVPSVIGSLRPVILLPASALTGLTAEQLEMVLAHELAHVRRHDFAVNLFQAFVETLMFFHPAVWWMSGRVRAERENCCDDRAVAVCGNPIQYARALTRLEELRAPAMAVGVSANGGSLIQRIQRIARGRAEATTMSARWIAAAAMLIVLALVVTVPSLPLLAQRDESKPDAKKPARSNVEVVAPRETPKAPRAVELALLEDDTFLDATVEHAISDAVNGDAIFDAISDDAWFDAVTLEVPEPPQTPEAPELPAHPVVEIGTAVPPAPAVAPVAVVAPVPGVAAAPLPPRPPFAIAGTPAAPFAPHPKARRSRRIGADGKLTVDDLVTLRAIGVTPEYVQELRGVLPALSLDDIVSMKAIGMTTEFIRQMKDAGYDASDAETLVALKAVDVSPAYVKEIAALGFDARSAKEVSALKAVGVTAAWVRDMRAAGIALSSAKDALSLRAVGVTPELVKELATAGYRDLSVRDLAKLAAHGIDADYIRDMEKQRDRK